MARSDFERMWQQVANVAAPEASEFRKLGMLGMLAGLPKRAAAANRSKYIFDSTGINAVDRLASGIEALVIPQSEYWHGIGVTDLTRDDYDDEEKMWFQRIRNMMFKVRYDADSGWVTASQTAIRRTIAFGNAFMFVEDDDDYVNDAMILYRHLPLAQCYIAEDHQGNANTFYRYYALTATQALGKFKEKTPEKIRKATEHPTDKDKEFAFIQCIHPRGDWGMSGRGLRRTRWASFHVFEEEKSVISESGYFEFPVIDFRWLPEQGMVYGEGPVMKCLADIQSLQQMAKNELKAGEQAVNPTLLMAHAGVMNRPANIPGHIVHGGLNAQGQELVKPMFQGQRLDFATMVLEAKRAQVKDAMYLNLFQLLVQNPQMSATEAMIRANEKGELLGPAGSRLQQSLSRLIERELGILSRRGLYDSDSVYRKPSTLQGRKTTAQMTSPLDRLRRAKEGEGTMRLLEIVSPLAQVEPEVVDNFDADETVRVLRDILGAPVQVLRDPKVRDQRRANRQAAQSQAQNAAIAEQYAAASKQGSDALASMKAAGAL